MSGASEMSYLGWFRDAVGMTEAGGGTWALGSGLLAAWAGLWVGLRLLMAGRWAGVPASRATSHHFGMASVI